MDGMGDPLNGGASKSYAITHHVHSR